MVTKEDVINIIRVELPKLFKEDEDFKYKIFGLFAETFASKEDIERILHRIDKLREDFDKVIARIEKIEERQEEHSRVIAEHSRRIEEHSKVIEKITLEMRRLDSKWGVTTEKTFHHAIKGILERHFGMEVRKWRVYDEKGEVFDRPRFIEADLMIKDGEHILIEIKGSISLWDIYGFYKVCEYYKSREGVTKVTPYIVSTHIPDEAKAVAELYEIVCFTTDDIGKE